MSPVKVVQQNIMAYTIGPRPEQCFPTGLIRLLFYSFNVFCTPIYVTESWGCGGPLVCLQAGLS